MKTLTRENWIQGNLAVDDNGNSCRPRSDQAVKFCLLGALEREYTGALYLRMRTALSRLLYTTITAWNDQPGRTWEEVEFVIQRMLYKEAQSTPQPVSIPSPVISPILGEATGNTLTSLAVG